MFTLNINNCTMSITKSEEMYKNINLKYIKQRTNALLIVKDIFLHTCICKDFRNKLVFVKQNFMIYLFICKISV